MTNTAKASSRPGSVVTVLICVENGSKIEDGGWQNDSRRTVKAASLFFPSLSRKRQRPKTEALSANFEWQSEANKHVTGLNGGLSLAKVRDPEHGPIRLLPGTYQEASVAPSSANHTAEPTAPVAC